MKGLGIWVCFLLGQAVFVLGRASWAIRNPSNPIATRKQFLYLWWDVILFRAVVEAGIFWIFWFYPGAFTSLAHLIGKDWNLDIPLIPPLAFFAGLGGDFILDLGLGRFPAFQRQVPHLPDRDTKV